MFTNFTTMYYIYSLTIDDLIVYIGFTIDPVKRFHMHYKDVGSRLYRPLRWMLSEGRVCQMNIICSCPFKIRALRIEDNYIKEYSKTYQLANTLPEFYFSRLFPNYLIDNLPVSISKSIKGECE